MFAVVDIAGHQYKVAESKKCFVPRLDAEPNAELTFSSVMLVASDSGTKVGTPYVENASVQVKVIEHVKEDKVIVFKKKRRISYKKKVGHRQPLTRIEVLKINS